ncbi:MAG: hypothetical protein ABW137_34265, partial [Mycobacterium sp.]
MIAAQLNRTGPPMSIEPPPQSDDSSASHTAATGEPRSEAQHSQDNPDDPARTAQASERPANNAARKLDGLPTLQVP